MVKLAELVDFLDNTLNLKSIPGDSSNNGLQIEGASDVKKACFSVDACKELFDIAEEKNADFVFVHHGMSWGGSFKRLTGLTASRLNVLFSNNISLYAAHLPLDAHETLGHNVLMAEMIDLKDQAMFADYCGAEIGVKGELAAPSNPESLAQLLCEQLGGEYTLFGQTHKTVKTVGIISGGAGSDGVEEAAAAGLDCLITGEVGHTCFHPIKESGLNVISLGHYSSETCGVKAVMELIMKQYQLECEFVDIPTGL